MNNNGHKILNRGISLGAKRKTKTVEVPDLDCDVILRELSIAQLDGIENDMVQQLALMIVDENGQRVYTSPEDLQELSEMSATVATALIREAANLNGASKEAVDSALKNFEASPNADSAGA